MKGYKTPIHAAATWVRRQPPKIKIFLAVITAIAALVFLRMVVEDHDSLFVVAEAVHAIGISVLIYKLTKERTCAGLFWIWSFSEELRDQFSVLLLSIYHFDRGP